MTKSSRQYYIDILAGPSCEVADAQSDGDNSNDTDADIGSLFSSVERLITDAEKHSLIKAMPFVDSE